MERIVIIVFTIIATACFCRYLEEEHVERFKKRFPIPSKFNRLFTPSNVVPYETFRAKRLQEEVRKFPIEPQVRPIND